MYFFLQFPYVCQKSQSILSYCIQLCMLKAKNMSFNIMFTMECNFVWYDTDFAGFLAAEIFYKRFIGWNLTIQISLKKKISKIMFCVTENAVIQLSFQGNLIYITSIYVFSYVSQISLIPLGGWNSTPNTPLKHREP